MAKLSPETTAIINSLKQVSLDIVDEAARVEFIIFERFGETQQTLSYMEEMQNTREEGATLFSRLSTLQLQIAQIQPMATLNQIEQLNRTISLAQAKIPVLERNIQEVKLEWNLP